MNLPASCIEGGLYVRKGVLLKHPEQRGPELRGIARAELRHGGSWDGTGTHVSGPGRPNLVVNRCRMYGARIAGTPVIVVTQLCRVIWIGRPIDVVHVIHPEFTKSGTGGILNFVLGEENMNYVAASTAPMAPPAALATVCVAPVEDQIKAAELKVAALRARQAEEQEASHAQAVADARKAELSHQSNISHLECALVAEVTAIERGTTPTVFRDNGSGFVVHRRELTPYLEKLGYKFVTVGQGGAVCLCKRGAK